MTGKEGAGTEKALFEALDALFDDLPSPETEAEVTDYLQECGYDPEAAGARFKALSERLADNSPLNWRNRAPEEHDEARAARRARQGPDLSREDILAAIRRKMAPSSSGRPRLAGAQFRNEDLDTASREELAEILADLEYLEDK